MRTRGFLVRLQFWKRNASELASRIIPVAKRSGISEPPHCPTEVGQFPTARGHWIIRLTKFSSRCSWILSLITTNEFQCTCKSSLLGDDFNPVVVRVIDKVDSHRLVLITDAAHLFMPGMGACKIVDFESQMEFIVTQIVRLFSILEPSQLELVQCLTVAEKDDNETAVRRFKPSNF